MITYRFAHASGGFGFFTQNLFCAIADQDTALLTNRSDVRVRIIPVDYDRSRFADTGYSGWVELPDGNIFIVNYIVDDAVNLGQIRGYLLNPDELYC